MHESDNNTTKDTKGEKPVATDVQINGRYGLLRAKPATAAERDRPYVSAVTPAGGCAEHSYETPGGFRNGGVPPLEVEILNIPET